MIAGQGGEQLIVQGETGLHNGYVHCDILPGRSGRFTAGVNGTLREGDPRKTHYRNKQAALSVR
jgi:hypothetical protein